MLAAKFAIVTKLLSFVDLCTLKLCSLLLLSVHVSAISPVVCALAFNPLGAFGAATAVTTVRLSVMLWLPGAISIRTLTFELSNDELTLNVPNAAACIVSVIICCPAAPTANALILHR